MELKACIDCKQSLPLSKFKYSSNPSYSHSRRCKQCLHKISKSKKDYSKHYPSWWKEAIARDRHTCRDCGAKDVSLVVHHVDESRKNGHENMNNDLNNLITICRPCHAIRHGHKKDYGDILMLKKSGMTYQEIGDLLGVSRQRAHKILNDFSY